MDKIAFPFRSPTNQRYSKQLFLEPWRELPVEERLVKPIFTLDQERDGYTCFRKEYIQDADPSGYKTSTRLLGDYGYWKFLMKAGWFRDAVERWDEELDAKLYGEGMDKIRELATSESKSAMVAARFLVEQGYRKSGKRGRPTKEEIQGKLKQAVKEAEGFDEDAARIGLVKK